MKRIDWHAGFVSAMKLELLENADDLVFEEEHYIANRAQRIDLLIIKKERYTVIRSILGKGFETFNIFEYKGPGGSLTYGDFYKVMAYTGLYLGETQIKGKEHNAEEYTMTFVRESHPYCLFKRLVPDGIDVTAKSPGIYELTNNLPFKTRVIVTKELNDTDGSWISCLTKNGTAKNLDSIVRNTTSLDKHNKEYADNVMDVFTSANDKLVINEMRKEPAMCNAVNELFADRIYEMERIIADKDLQLADKDAKIADMVSTINELRAKLEEYSNKKKV